MGGIAGATRHTKFTEAAHGRPTPIVPKAEQMAVIFILV
jgi:hypothetical protein